MTDGNGFTMSDENNDSKEALPKIDFSSFCGKGLTVNLDSPDISFKLAADSKKAVEFTENYVGNFTGSEGNVYTYSDGEIESMSITNFVEGKFEIIESNETNESTGILPQTGSSSGSSDSRSTGSSDSGSNSGSGTQLAPVVPDAQSSVPTSSAPSDGVIVPPSAS